jgi:hypothetical protein
MSAPSYTAASVAESEDPSRMLRFDQPRNPPLDVIGFQQSIVGRLLRHQADDGGAGQAGRTRAAF